MQGVAIDDLIDFTPELRAEAVKLVSKYRIGPMFTPPVGEQGGRPAGDACTSPGSLGGANWPGGSYDPETHKLYVFSQSAIALLGLVPTPGPGFSDMEYVQGNGRTSHRSREPAGWSAAAGRESLENRRRRVARLGRR